MPDTLIYIIISTVCLVTYHGSLDCGFVFDDVSAIKDNKDLRPDTPWQNLFYNDFWGTPMVEEKSHKSYRPLTVLTFRLNYWLSELRPFSYHLVNVLIHSLVSVQLFWLCNDTMNLSQLASLGSSLLFAVHPVHTEAVTGVVGRAELLSACLSLLIFQMYTHRISQCGGLNVPAVLLLFILLVSATLCKEQGLTIAAVCLVYDWFIIQQLTVQDAFNTLKRLCTLQLSSVNNQVKPVISRCVIVCCMTFIVLALRLSVMGAQLPSFTPFDNPASNQTSPYRQFTYNYLTVYNMFLLVCPAQLCCDWTMGTLPVIDSVLDPRNFLTIILYMCVCKLVHYCLWSRTAFSGQLLTGMLFIVVPFIPASNLFFPVGFVIAERVLYMPSVGYCIIVGSVINLLYHQSHTIHKRLLLASMCLLIISGVVRSCARNRDWQNEYTLFTSALRFTKNNAKVWNNVGHALEAEGNHTEALQYFNNAVRAQPDDIGSHINVGRTLKVLGRVKEAEVALKTALNLLPPVKKGQSYMARVAPSHLNVFITLGTLISQDASRLQEAEKLYKQAISMRPTFVQAYINYGDILLKMGRKEEALSQYKLAVKYEEDNPDIYYNMGVVYLEMGQPQLALGKFNIALRMDPDHQLSLYNAALVVQELALDQLYPQALQRLQRLMSLQPDNSKVHFTAALLATDSKQYQLAEQQFKLALEIDPNFKGALFNLALLLVNELVRPAESVPYLERNLELNPDHIKSYLLLGDVAINHLKNIELAEQCFSKVIELDPTNVQGRHNLCVVYVERGDLVKAERCLADVLKLAPQLDYVRQHLQVVRSKMRSAANRDQT